MPQEETRASSSGFCPVVAHMPVGAPLDENSYRRVIECAPSALVMIDRAGTMVLVNAQAGRLFGYALEALVGQSVEMLLPARFRPHHQTYRAGYFGDPSPRPMGAGRDLLGCRADGSEFPIEIGLNPIGTEAGAMVLASIIDISERLRAQQRLEDALREKTVLLNEVHHRVKNNLQVITSLLNLQADHAADPRLRAILGESCGRVKAMSLTHQLLYEHKEFSHLDLADYLQRLVQSIRATYRAADARIVLRCEFPPGGIHLELERAIPCGLLVNELLSNSFKHAFPGERRGEIVVVLGADADGQIDLCVSDNGIGLPDEAVLAQSPTLGLQLVPLFVDQLHGSLTMTGDGGAHFRVRFPQRSTRKDAP